MNPPLPSTPPNRPPYEGVTTALLSTPLNNGMSAVAEHGNDWRRMEVIKWLVNDVARTQDASALGMLHAFTKRIMPKGSNENPENVFKRILQRVIGVRESAEAQKAARKARTKRKKKKNAKSPTAANRIFNRMSQAYSEFLAASSENDTYQPFVTMTNSALHLLKEASVEGALPRNTEDDILLQHNDPNLLTYKMNGKEHSRKPDNIFVTLKTAQKLHGSEKLSWSSITATHATKSLTKHGKHRPILDWGDALCSVEHKRTCSINPSEPLEIDENTTLPSLHDLSRLRNMRKRSRDERLEDGDTAPSPKRQKTTQSRSRVTTTGPSHASSETAQAYKQGPEPGPDLLNSVAIQSAEYGLGRLCCSYDISHTFTLIVADGVLHISWYDHEGIITTTGINLAKYFDYYLALLFILQRFDRSGWGRLADEDLRSNRNGTEDETIVSVEGKEFKFNMKEDNKVLRKPFAIGGRATSLYQCQKVDDDPVSDYVIKFTWKEETRLSEQFILQEIKTRHSTSMDQNSSAEVFDESDDLLSYLPQMVAGVETKISTKTIREDLGIASDPRVLVVIVFVMLDGTISELNGEEYWQVLWDCIRCHKRLYKLGIYHCDISNSNLMYIRKNGYTFGILIDFDLAVITGLPSKNKRRTGTRPFMPIDLLRANEPIPRHYKHDIESFFWVVVYDTAGGKLEEEWALLDNLTLAKEKYAYLAGGTEVVPMEETHGSIVNWVQSTGEFLLQDRKTKTDWSVDALYNTLRGFRSDEEETLAARIESRQAEWARIGGGQPSTDSLDMS